MDRVTVYPGQIPLETDVLRTNKFGMMAVAKLAAAMLGTSTVVNGLACVPTSPASLQVNVNPGEMYSLVNVDATAYSSLAADTTHSILKQGISLDAVALNCPAPATGGQSINYLIQATYQDTDTDNVALPYYNASNPSQAWSGPNNSGTPQSTTRKGAVVISAKAGTAATTGTQTTPAPDSGYTGLWVVTVANGQSTITAGNITQATNAPILPADLLHSIQQNALTSTVDVGSANTYVVNYSPAIQALTNNMVLFFEAKTANNGASTLNVNGLGAIPLVGGAHAALQGGEIVAGGKCMAIYKTSINSAILIECTGGAVQIAPATQSQHAVQFGQLQASFRNRLINGCFQVDQRNAGAAQTITAGAALAYTVDRWYAYCTGANVTGQQVAGNGPDQYAYKFTGAAGVTGLSFGQRIESVNSYDLNSSTATLQAKLSSSTLTTVTWTAYYANTKDTFGTVASPTKTQIATGTFTINSTPTVYSAQVAVPAAATTGICIEFSVGAFTSGTLTYENAQFEVGNIASAIERPDLSTVLNRCLRYCYQTSYTVGGGQSYSGQVIYTSQPFPTIMRVSPTITAIGSVSTSGAANGGPTITANTFNSVLAMSAFNALNTNGTAVGTTRFDSEL